MQWARPLTYSVLKPSHWTTSGLTNAQTLAELAEHIGNGSRVVIKHPRDWGEPTIARLKAEIAQLLSGLQVFLQKSFILGKKALKIKANIPPRPQRKKKSTPT